MNLLTDPWVPVEHDGRFRHVTYEDVLCVEGDWRISLPRDDMEFAGLQMLICLTQSIFMPSDTPELDEREANPMPKEEFLQGIRPFMEWFDLFHPKWPFMQVRGVKGKPRSMQKLFVGLPEKHSDSPTAFAFFNTPDELPGVCPSCAAIALFQQATNGFGLGGAHFPVGLKGSMPMSTITLAPDLRRTIWRNTLSRQFLESRIPNLAHPRIREPTWIKSVRYPQGKGKPRLGELARDISLMRGLFWQPAKVELETAKVEESYCSFCQGRTTILAVGFKQQSSKHERVLGWIHPHTPYEVKKDGVFPLRCPSQRDFWEQLPSMIWELGREGPAGTSPALSVSQEVNRLRADERITIVAAGYIKGKTQEKLQGRRHAIVSLAPGWRNGEEAVSVLISRALDVDAAIRTVFWLFAFGGEGGPRNSRVSFEGALMLHTDRMTKRMRARKSELEARISAQFFADAEPHLYRTLRDMDFARAKETITQATKCLCSLGETAFQSAIDPYRHTPKGARAAALTRLTLRFALAKVQKGESPL